MSAYGIGNAFEKVVTHQRGAVFEATTTRAITERTTLNWTSVGNMSRKFVGVLREFSRPRDIFTYERRTIWVRLWTLLTRATVDKKQTVHYRRAEP